MKIKGLTTTQLDDCAKAVGVDLGNIRKNGNYVHFKVNLIGETYRKYRHERKVWAVCWHGFRDFFREVYMINSDARVVTALATYKDVLDFELNHSSTGYINIGSQFQPLMCKDACNCH